MTALLGLLAIAGYQNRDKIAEMLRGAPSNPLDPAAPTKTGAREATPGLGGILGGASLGDTLSGGLRELVDAFRQKGQGDVADSWVARGPNKQIAPAQLEQTIGADVLQTLSQQTGMSREEILARLSKICPMPSTSIPPKAASRAQRTFLEGDLDFVKRLAAGETNL